MERREEDDLHYIPCSSHPTTAMILDNICQVDGWIYSQHPTTTEELCSVLLTGKGSVITIITKLGYVKAFTPCVPLILTYVHKQAMKTIPIGSSWHYSVTRGLLITQEMRHGFIILKQGPQGITLRLQRQTNSMSRIAIKIMASFLRCGGRTIRVFLTFWDLSKFKDYNVNTIKKNETLNLTNLFQLTNVWQQCHATRKSVQTLDWLYCSTLPIVQTSPYWINTYFILSRKNCEYIIIRISPWRISVTKHEEQQSRNTGSFHFTWFFWHDFALLQLENLYHFSNLCENFQFNVIWHRSYVGG